MARVIFINKCLTKKIKNMKYLKMFAFVFVVMIVFLSVQRVSAYVNPPADGACCSESKSICATDTKNISDHYWKSDGKCSAD